MRLKPYIIRLKWFIVQHTLSSLTALHQAVLHHPGRGQHFHDEEEPGDDRGQNGDQGGGGVPGGGTSQSYI